MILSFSRLKLEILFVVLWVIVVVNVSFKKSPDTNMRTIELSRTFHQVTELLCSTTKIVLL